jgi:hypothetical protein
MLNASAAIAAFAAAQNANNVLVSSCEASPNGLVAKLADLGLSRVINQHRTHRTTHTVSNVVPQPLTQRACFKPHLTFWFMIMDRQQQQQHM